MKKMNSFDQNRSSTKDLEEFNEQVRNLKSGSTFLLRVVRQNRSF